MTKNKPDAQAQEQAPKLNLALEQQVLVGDWDIAGTHPSPPFGKSRVMVNIGNMIWN